MFDNKNEQDDFFAETDSDFSQQDFQDSSADFFNTEEQFQTQDSPELPQRPQQTSFGYKTVGIVVALGLVILALIVLGLSNIKLVKKTNENNQAQVQQEQQASNTGSNTTVPTSTESASNTESTNQQSSSTTSLINIPSNTYMDYSNKAIQAQGVVTSLSKYLQDGQVIYCINLDITMGTATNTVHYYCGYNVFKQVEVGDILNVEYQQVSETCYSVCTISK